MKGVNHLLEHHDEIINNLDVLIAIVSDCQELEEQLAHFEAEITSIRLQIEELFEEHSHTTLEQESFDERYEDLHRQYESNQRNQEQVKKDLAERKERGLLIQNFKKQLSEQSDLVIDFEQGLWQTLLEKLVVSEQRTVMLEFKDGSQIEL